jgi:hypothetical protein
MVGAAGRGEDLERDLQALVTDSTLRQAEPVTLILPDIAADDRGRTLGAAASWNRRFGYARAERAPSRSPFVRPAIADTSTARRPVAARPGAPVSAPRAAVTNRVLKGGSIIATGSGRIGRAAA